MSLVPLHAGPSGLAHVLVDTALSVGLGVAVVALYLLFLRYVVKGNGRGTR